MKEINYTNRREFLQNASLSVLGLNLFSFSGGKEKSAKRPNLVFVFPDQYRVHAMGFMKEDPVVTPNIDKFASESKVFTNAVSNWPLCSPYRGMLMTGRWPHSTGIITNCNSSQPDVYLRKSERTFTDVLSEAGYDVGYLGKWHLDTPQGVPVANHWSEAIWDAYPPLDSRHGINFWHAYGCHNRHLDPYYYVGNAAEGDKFFPKEYSPAHESKVTARFIENTDSKQRDANKPFAIFVSMNPPHGPYHEVPKKYKKLFADKPPKQLLNRSNVEKGHKQSLKSVRDYFSQVYSVDEAFGRILDSIDHAGLREDTIVVFSADHGEMMGSHGLMGKTSHYEESLRIPFIIRWPGKIPKGKDGLHINVPDVMPSLLSLMNLKDKTPRQVQGTDYSKAFIGRNITRPVSTFYMKCADNNPKSRGVRTDRYTFVVEHNEDNTFNYILHDNQNDPYQLENIASKSPGLVKKLTEELKNWIAKTNDPWKGISDKI